MIDFGTESVFVDTAFFKALADPKDDFHLQAIKILEQIEKESVRLVTTNFVLDETITLIRVRCGLERVKKFREILAGLASFKIYRILIKDEEKAWDWFWNDWSHLSFTDCVSFAVMKRLGIDRAATFDRHFVKAGFKIA